jgi:hypothetical protein
VADLIGSEDWRKSEPMSFYGRDPIEFTIEGSTVVRRTIEETESGNRAALCDADLAM